MLARQSRCHIDTYDVTEDDFREEIHRSVDAGNSLDFTNELIAAKFGSQLHPYELCIIEEIYVNYLTASLLETPEKIGQAIQFSCILEFTERLDLVSNFVDCYKLLHSLMLSKSILRLPPLLTYLSLLIEVSKTSHKLKKEEARHVDIFKLSCRMILISRCNTVENEQLLLEHLLDLFKSWKSPRKLCESLGLSPETFDFENTIHFKQFLNRLIQCNLSNEYILKAQRAAREIIDEDNITINKEIKEIVSSFLEPTIVQEINVDGRVILEVSGKHLVISEVIDEIEGKLKRFYQKIEEVRFVNAYVIHIDTNLDSKIWHGKNVVVCAYTAIVSDDKNIIWDVSGQDAAKSTITSDAGTGVDGCGLRGADGQHGESGGNVLIIVEDIKNGASFTVKSYGGKGSNGQDGGNGVDGEEGDYLDKKAFKALFPPVSKFWDNEKKERLETTTNSLLRDFECLEELFVGNTYLGLMPKSGFETFLSNQTKEMKSFYLKMKTKNGCKITFSFYYEDFSICQSFLLHQGSSGREGKPGGFGGKKGLKGYAGEIDVQVSNSSNLDITILKHDGEDGLPGIMGSSGSPGNSGLDRAYEDYTFTIKNTWPKWFIPEKSENKKLKVTYHSEDNSDRVYCLHNNLYAEIVEREIEFKRVNKHRSDFNQTSEVKVTETDERHNQRKKTISEDSIRNQYPQKQYSASFSKNNYSLIKNAKTILQNKQIDVALESEHLTSDLKIIQQASYFEQNLNNLINTSTGNLFVSDSLYTPCNKVQGQSSAELVEIVKNCPLVLNNWIKLLNIHLDIFQLRDLWDTAFTSFVNNEVLTKGSKEQLNIAFCNKYQLAVMKHLANEVTSLHETDSVTKLSDMAVNSVDMFFTISNEEKTTRSNVHHFFLNDCDKERGFILAELQELLENPSDNIEILNKTLIEFINEFYLDATLLEEGNGEVLQALLKILQEVSAFRKNNEGLLCTLLDILKNALWREKDQSLFSVLHEGIVTKNTTSMVAFENKICDDKFLSSLYTLYVTVAQKQYSWDILRCDHFDNTEILKYIVINLKKKGPFSACYREFMAYHFETNILVYSVSNKNQFVLTHNHNPRARSSVHFLLNGNKFEYLNVNNDFVEMYKSQITQSKLVKDILIQIDSFTEKEQFDNFISTTDLCKEVHANKSLKIRFKLINVLMEDNNIRKILKAFHLVSQEEMYLLPCMLEKLKYEYTGCESILHILALHFESEGSHISPTELYYVINFVLKCALNMPYIIPLVSWILAAYCQSQWLVEIILLKFELNLKRIVATDMKSKWRSYLSKQNEREILMLLMEKICEEHFDVSEDQFEEILYLLSNISQAHLGLEQLKLTEWKYYLKNKFWANQLKKMAEWPYDILNHASYQLVVFENLIGFELCKKFVDVLEEHKSELANDSIRALVPSILSTLTNKEVSLNSNLLELLKNNKVNEWVTQIENECYTTDKDRDLDKLIQLIKDSGNTSIKIKKNLDDISKAVKQSNVCIETMMQHITDMSKLKEWLSVLLSQYIGEKECFTDKIKCFLKECNVISDQTFKDLGKALIKVYQGDKFCSAIRKECNSVENCAPEITFETLFATVVRAIEIKYKITLRDTQKLAVMIMLRSRNSTLSQISTGEGKSFIIVIFSIIKVLMEEQQVNIITSSRVLAIRDAHEYKDVYSLFGINVGHNCSEDIQERKTSYSNNKVIYGDLANFQRDFLLDHVYNKNIIGDRVFETIVVDEVDSMLLDKGNNTLYLSHEIPGLDKLESIFIYIWKSLHIPVESSQPKLEQTVSVLKKRILHDIFGLITKEHLHSLDKSLGERDVNCTWAFLVRKGIIDNSGKVLKLNIDDELETLPINCIHECHLKYIFKKLSERETSLNVPNYLKKFVEEHLEEWIKNGLRAMTMEPGVDYVVDIDRSESSSDHSPNILIVDQDTGTDLTNSQWENGLHQFLQLKHGCRISLISLKAVFKSNVCYLKMYKHLYGLTGTLGSEVERKLLQETYQVDFVTIPTAKTKRFKEEIPIVCSSREDWLDTVCKEVYMKSKNRSILIICETVNDVLALKKRFHEVFPKIDKDTLQTYTRDYEQLTITENLQVGCIIISTNLAGRGTDIILSEELKKAGGLHVCLSYLPRNSRIEEQAFGRAARNGQPGSGQIIFQNCSQGNALTIIHLKQQRDINEVLRISDVKAYHKSYLQQEEDCFQEFLKVYTLINDSSHPEDIKSILLQVSLDLWAFWLEKHSSSINIESLKTFTERITILKEDKLEDWLTVIEDPFQLIKLGLVLVSKKQYNESILLFNQVIEKEPLYSEGAYYYRLYAKSNHNEEVHEEEILTDMSIVTKKLMERINTLYLAAYTIDSLKKRNPTALQINSFKEQQLNISKIYSVFLQSIHNVIGYGITFEEFMNPMFVDEDTAYEVFNDLIKEGVLKKLKVKKCISKEDFSFVVKYGLSPEDLLSVLKKYKDREFEEDEILNELESSCLLPSRELFWSTLLSKHILTNEKTYCIVDMKKLECVDPSSINIVRELKENLTEDQNEIWLYHPNEIGYSDTDCVVVEKEILKGNIGESKYTVFLKKSVISLNCLATCISPGDNINFDQFDTLKREDFEKLGISSDTALQIIHELEVKCIIKKHETDEEYMLLADKKQLENVVLSQFEAYSNDVVKLLKYCFSFKIALEEIRLLKAEQKENDDKLWLPLGIRLHINLIKDLYEREIISKHSIDPEVDVSEKLTEMYPDSMTKEKFTNLFKQLYDTETSKSIVEELVHSKWLKKDMFGNKYSISVNEKNIEPLSSYLNSQGDTIKLILQKQLNLKKNEVKVYFENIIDSHTNKLHRVETPNFSLLALTKELKKHKLPSSEYRIFSLNGFNDILLLIEKKYTFKMLVSTSSIFVGGIVQIASGVAMQVMILSSAAGAACVGEGISDIIYSISSLYTGYFNWREYAKHKIVNLIITACLFLKPVEMFKSIFGQSISSQSSSWVTSAKNECSSVFQKAKDVFKNFRGIFKTTASTVETSLVIKTVAKQVVYETAVGCSIGLSYVAVDNYLQPAFEGLAEELVERILGDIDEIDNHNMITYVKEIYAASGEKKSKIIVDTCYSQVLDKYKSKNINEWMLLVNKLTATLRKECFNCFREFRSKDSSLLDNSGALLFQLLPTIQKLHEIINMSYNIFPGRSMISNIMDELEQLFKENLDKLKESTKGSKCANGCDRERFISQCLDDLKSQIKMTISENINRTIIFPLLSVLKTSVGEYLINARRKLPSFYEKKDLEEITKHNEHSYKNMEFNHVDDSESSKSFYSAEYNECLIEIFKRKRSAPVYLEILKQKSSVDEIFLEACCSIIPMALRQEGLNVPLLRLVIEKEGKQYNYGGNGSVETDFLTITLSLDKSCTANVKKNETLLLNVLDSIYRTILKRYPQYRGFTADPLWKLVISAVESYLRDKDDIDTDSPTEIISDDIDKAYSHNTEEEMQTNSSMDKRTCYKKCNMNTTTLTTMSTADAKGKGVMTILKSQIIKSQVIEGFEAALKKINRHVQSIQPHLKSFKLSLEDFNESRHVIIANNEKGRYFDSCATEYDLVIPLTDISNKYLIDYNVTMNLKGRVCNSHPCKTLGSYIEYTIHPVNLQGGQHLDKSIKGHILLPFEYLENVYSIDKCHNAGELILPSPINKNVGTKVKKRFILPSLINKNVGTKVKSILYKKTNEIKW